MRKVKEKVEAEKNKSVKPTPKTKKLVEETKKINNKNLPKKKYKIIAIETDCGLITKKVEDR